MAQEGTVSGTVTDGQTGDPLPGANVRVAATSLGAATNSDGSFSISGVPTGEQVVTVSFVGYQEARRTVNVSAGETTTVNFNLAPDQAALEEVVVVGYGERDRQDVMGAVSSIGAEEIQDVPVSSPEQLLQGTAGVQVTTTSGMAGAGINVQVRGPTSITGSSSPLYVVDGVPVISGDFGSDVGTEATNALADLNPQNIKSIEVLKDAAATSIYGSRGANGVVLITTKGGGDQPTEVTFQSQLGAVQSTTGEWPVLNGEQWARVYEESFDNFGKIQLGLPNNDAAEGIEALFGYPVLPEPGEAQTVDHVGKVFETGLRKQANLSVRGGNESTQFYLSGSIDQNDNYIVTNEFETLGGLAKLDHNITDWARTGVKVNVSRTINNRAASDNLVSAPLTSSALIPPIVPIRNDDGSFNFQNPWNIAANSIADSEINSYDAKNWRILPNAYIEVDPISNLTLRAQGGADILAAEEFFRYGAQTTDGAPTGFGESDYREQRRYTFNATADYQNTFANIHRFASTVGAEYQYQQRRNVEAAATGFPSDDFQNVGSAASPSVTNAFIDRKSRLESYFARANYTYDNRYTAELSGRVDGSSRFAEDNRYGVFPAGAVAWTVSEESFMQGFDFLSQLKLRASYGITGNNQIGTFGSLGLFGTSNYAENPGIAPAQLPNSGLQWERVGQTDIGLDVGLFDGRIFLTTNFWRKTANELILGVPLPLTSGFDEINRNVGEMRNQGVDLSLETRNFTGEFSWSTSITASYFENEVRKLQGDERRIIGGNFADRVAQVGKPIGTFYMIPYEGVDPQTGKPLWRDQDGNLTDEPTSSDRRLFGNNLPDWTGSISNRFSWNGIQLSARFNFEEGRQIYNSTKEFMSLPATFNLHEDILNRWQETGDQTDVPRLTFADLDGAARTSSRFLEDGSFIRLKNVKLSYTFPQSLIEGYGIKSAQVFVQGQNLLTFDRLSVGDPSGSTAGTTGSLAAGDLFFTPPLQRTISGGIRVTLQ